MYTNILLAQMKTQTCTQGTESGFLFSTMLLYIHRACMDYSGWGAQDGHLDFHTAPVLFVFNYLKTLHTINSFADVQPLPQVDNAVSSFDTHGVHTSPKASLTTKQCRIKTKNKETDLRQHLKSALTLSGGRLGTLLHHPHDHSNQCFNVCVCVCVLYVCVCMCVCGFFSVFLHTRITGEGQTIIPSHCFSFSF